MRLKLVCSTVSLCAARIVTHAGDIGIRTVRLGVCCASPLDAVRGLDGVLLCDNWVAVVAELRKWYFPIVTARFTIHWH